MMSSIRYSFRLLYLCLVQIDDVHPHRFGFSASGRTIQKEENTIQKKLGANDEKILNYLKTHPKSTIDEIVRGIDGISLGGVKFVIGKLQKEGFLKRVGGRKFGE